MTEPLMLPLRPPSGKPDAADTIRTRIIQIHEQKGSFRHVTEQSLLEEIDASPPEEADVDMNVDEGDESDDDRDNRLEKLYKGREEILKQINTARNEAYSALDFISLLLTKHKSVERQAESSMSPFLKELKASGTIDMQKVKASGPSAEEKARTELVSNGWKLESFSSSAERLLGASSRLQKEASRESKYWEQVSKIKADGWAVSRLPQEKHTLGVHFGFSEATPSFRNRGVAALRPSDDGSLFLDRGISTSQHRAIQVSISEGDQQIGASTLPADTSTESDAVEQEVLQARNSLFEEELFHEANREARSMANLGVISGHDFVTFDLPEKKRVELRLQRLEDSATTPPVSGTMNESAEIIALSLRLLLSRAHRKNFERRTRPPPPITNKPRQTPEYALLRPIMALLQHRQYVDSLSTWLSEQLRPLQVAGLTTSLSSKPLLSIEQNLNTNSRGSENVQWKLVESLTGMLESSMEIQLPSAHKLEIKLRSLMGPPVWGTEFVVSEISWPSTRLPASRHTMLSDCQNSISQIILEDVATTIEGISTSATERATALKWKSEKPFSTSLIARNGPSQSGLQFLLTPSALLVRLSPAIEGKKSRRLLSYAWMQDGQVKKEVGGKRGDAEGLILAEVLEKSLQELSTFD